MAQHWSLLLYMTASPRLVPHARETLKRLCAAAPSERLDVAVQLDARGAKKPVRYRIENGRAVAAPSATWAYRPRQALRDFLDWGLAKPSSARSALVMWGEGGGWIYPAGLYDAPGRGLIDAELRTAIAASRHGRVDVLGFDACLMGMVEILYGVRELCRAQVASETFVPLQGWPYRTMLDALARKPASTGEAWAERVVPCIQSVRASSTLAAFDARRADAIAAAFRQLAGELRRVPVAARTEIARARAEMIHVGNPLFVDVLSMLRGMERCVNDRRVGAAVGKTRREIARARLANASAGADNRGMSGLSIFFPEAKTSFLGPYQDLEFAKKTGWGAFLERFLAG